MRKIQPQQLWNGYRAVGRTIVDLRGNGTPQNPGAGSLADDGVAVAYALIEVLSTLSTIAESVTNAGDSANFSTVRNAFLRSVPWDPDVTPQAIVAPAMAAFDAAIAGYGPPDDHLEVAQGARAKLYALGAFAKVLPAPADAYRWMLAVFDLSPQ